MQTAIGIVFIVFIFVALPVGFLLLRDWVVSRRKASPTEIARQQANRKKRLLNPDFSSMADYLGVDIPQEIIDMYSNKELIQRTDVEVRNPADANFPFMISAFFPADPADYKNIWQETKQRFCIAESPFGDPYYVDVEEAGLPVYVYYHDGGDTEKVAPTLREFLSWIIQ